MIEKETVLIVGAGASFELDIPSGDILRNNIIGSLIFEENDQAIIDETGGVFRSDLVNKLLHLGYNRKTIELFRNHFLESDQPSIDEFLLRSKTDHFNDIGKVAIAYFMLGAENHNRLYNAGHWLKVLWRSYLTVTDVDDYINHKLNIITYNYDRAIEHYIFNSLQKTFNLTNEDTAEIVNKKPVVHLHGKLGFLGWENPDEEVHPTIPYGAPNDQYDTLVHASKRITLIGEASSIDPFNVAEDLIEEAEQIYFLGFGYHQANLDRLQLSEIVHSEQLVIGSCHGVSARRQNEISQYMGSGKIKLINKLCTELLTSNFSPN